MTIVNVTVIVNVIVIVNVMVGGSRSSSNPMISNMVISDIIFLSTSTSSFVVTDYWYAVMCCVIYLLSVCVSLCCVLCWCM